MNRLLPFLFAFATSASHAETPTWPDEHAQYGRLIIAQLPSAPFPHPKRAEGHQYKDQFFPAKDHYTDNTVGIFIPKGFRETGRIDFVVHFHGWRNNVEGVFHQYKLIEQLVESGRNAILVVPQGPRNASDSFGGKLEDPDGFKRFMGDVANTLQQQSALKQTNFAIGKIILSGHSGGYEVISGIVDHGGMPDSVAEVWLFDALYAQTDKYLAWFDQHHGRLLNIYTEHGGTKEETENLMKTLKHRGTAYFAGKEGEASLDDLKSSRLVFLFTDLEHNDVLEKHKTFRDFLKTSCLEER